LLFSKEKRKIVLSLQFLLFQECFSVVFDSLYHFTTEVFSPHFIEPKILYSFYSEVVIEVRVFVKEIEKSVVIKL